MSMLCAAKASVESRIAFWTPVAIGLVPGFITYGRIRAASETVGLTVGTPVYLLFGVIFPLGFFGLPLILPKLWDRRWPAHRLVSALAVGLFAGSVVAETSMLADEARFACEVKRNGLDQGHSRARAWPHGNTSSLDYIPGEGTYAHD